MSNPLKVWMTLPRFARLVLCTFACATLVRAQRPRVTFKLPDPAGKMMTRADFASRYVLLVHQGIP